MRRGAGQSKTGQMQKEAAHIVPWLTAPYFLLRSGVAT
jgi:hypothetical protein